MQGHREKGGRWGGSFFLLLFPLLVKPACGAPGEQGEGDKRGEMKRKGEGENKERVREV